jgi:hypothetical protein
MLPQQPVPQRERQYKNQHYVNLCRNLERRLQAAQNRNDWQLIQLLEREREQLDWQQ